MFWQWATVVGLSMTPALVLGQSAAAGAGIGFGFDAWVLVPVIAVAGFVEGIVLAWLAGASTKIGAMHRWLEKLRTPRATAWAERWGPWGGMMFGVAAVGQEPILIALRWLGVDMRRLLLPTAVSNLAFAIIYYVIVRLGFDISDLLR